MTPLSNLLHIITAGVTSIEGTYAAASIEFPSLDDPYKPNPVEAQVQQTADLVVSAAAQLISMLARPTGLISESMVGMFQSAAFGVVENANVAEILREAGPQGLRINVIGERAGVNADRLGRVLRLLATRNIFREVTPDVFANNKISSVLDTGKSFKNIKENPLNKHDGTNGFAAFVGHGTDESLRACGYLPEQILGPKGFLDEPNVTAFNTAFNTERRPFEWFELPEQALRRKRMGSAMYGTKLVFRDDAILEGFDWGSLPQGGVVVDVGGGVGSATMVLAKAHQSLRYVIQDLPVCLSDGLTFFEAQLPNALENGIVQFMAHDFLAEQPVKNASVFFLRTVIHDWPNASVQTILRHLRDAAQADTKLVLSEQIVPYVCPSTDVFVDIPGADMPLPPAPLLPNLGIVSSMMYALDMQMMSMYNGQERTVGQFLEVGASAGWKLVRIHRGSPGGLSQLVFVPV